MTLHEAMDLKNEIEEFAAQDAAFQGIIGNPLRARRECQVVTTDGQLFVVQIVSLTARIEHEFSSRHEWKQYIGRHRDKSRGDSPSVRAFSLGHKMSARRPAQSAPSSRVKLKGTLSKCQNEGCGAYLWWAEDGTFREQQSTADVHACPRPYARREEKS